MSYDAVSLIDLLAVCSETEDAAAWDELIHRFDPVIRGVVFRSARRWGEGSPETVEELSQDVYLKLCRNEREIIRKMAGLPETAVLPYLRVVAANLVNDQLAKRHGAQREPEGGVQSITDFEGSLRSQQGPEKTESEVLASEIDEILNTEIPAETMARDRKIFWLYYRQGFTARAIASIPMFHLTESGVESILLRTTQMVRKKLARSEGISTTGTY